MAPPPIKLGLHSALINRGRLVCRPSRCLLGGVRGWEVYIVQPLRHTIPRSSYFRSRGLNVMPITLAQCGFWTITNEYCHQFPWVNADSGLLPPSIVTNSPRSVQDLDTSTIEHCHQFRWLSAGSGPLPSIVTGSMCA
ncbi:hypothetical protein EVAR_3639_1 [Eumeta japonica]|uniref:Uncharacterized protein n=1 Tax=Eumeta variegata TaxID=151549 RepID=A0A4C1SVV0_EUMVA|nr:hypothetical protein EVAR_3639_1 [Eumeta japonica]